MKSQKLKKNLFFLEESEIKKKLIFCRNVHKHGAGMSIHFSE
jgi:hypothetical protein